MPRLSLSGFERADEAMVRALFEGLGLQGWSLADPPGADAVLVDLDSMYGQMAWLKGFPAGTVSIGLTRALRADTTHRIEAPLSGDALRRVLLAIEGEPSPLPPAPARTTREAPAVAVPPTSDRLASRIVRAAGAFAVQAEGLPRLVIDPLSQQFAPGKSLKALLGYGRAALSADAVERIDEHAAAEALRQAGDPQPLSRLVWLLALGGGEGPIQQHAPDTRFQLARWPQAEREFPKHFRIATVMLKAPATVAEIADASGASEAEVADYINAALTVGHASAA